jgi:hypothetical protein
MSPVLFRVTNFIVRENIEIYNSIITLRKKGHFLSCLILARSILENSVNLQYIYREDTEQRAKNFDLFAMSGYVNRASGLDDISQENAELLSKMEDLLNGKTIWDIFSELNLESFYITVYKRLSSFTHPTFNNRNFSQDRPFINFLRSLLVKEIYLMVLESIRVVSERFDMEDSISIIRDYPVGAVTVFSTNRKKSEEKQCQSH